MYARREMSINIPGFLKILIVIWALVQLSLCQRKVSYKGYSLIRITPTTEFQLQYLSSLTKSPGNGLNFWLLTTAVNHSADVMVEPSVVNSLTKNLEDVRMPYELLIPDLGKVIDDDLKSEVTVPRKYQFYRDYQSIELIGQYVRNLAYLYREHTSLIKIGTSFEGRPLEIIRITSKERNEPIIKPAIWIQGGAHAREQIGPAVVLFIAYKLASLYYESEEVYNLVHTFDWYFLPVLNPDGYNYCQLKDRLWRKTRSRDPNQEHCIGVDANRNWDIKWNATGSSSEQCSDNYAGSKPFSEPETKAASDFMKKNLKGRFEMFVDFHSYSQRWLTPWGFTSKLPPTYEEQKRVAEIGTSALKNVNGTVYSVGSSGNIMYTVSGGARDWVSDVLDAKYSYVVELRDKGQFGFLLPKRQILPTGRETCEAIKAMSLELLRLLHLDLFDYK